MKYMYYAQRTQIILVRWLRRSKLLRIRYDVKVCNAHSKETYISKKINK